MLKRLFFVVCILPVPSSVHGQACTPLVKLPQTVKAPIRSVIFTNDALPEEAKLEIVKQARNHDVNPKALDTEVSSIAEEMNERVRAAYQNEGYFKALVDAKAVPIPTDKHRYDVVVRVRTVGKLYRLGDLNISNATSFPTQQLRDLFPIQRGEVFSREKIADGLDAVRRLYGTLGYINYTSVPDTEFDDGNGIANLTIDVDEGKQFHLRGVEVLGVDEETKARVLGELDTKPGDIYSSESWERSLVKFPGTAQDPTPNVADKKLDERNGWVDMVLDFRKPRICKRAYSGSPILSPGESPAAQEP